MLTPEMVVQIGTTFGPVSGITILMAYILTRPKRTDESDSVAQLLSQLHELNARLASGLSEMNGRLIRVETILEERK